MTEKTHLAKIVEFLIRTNAIEKEKESGHATYEIVHYIVSLAVRHDWDVDAAVEHFDEVMETLDICGPSTGKLDPRDFLITQRAELKAQFVIGSSVTLNDLNQYFNFDLKAKKKSVPLEPKLG